MGCFLKFTFLFILFFLFFWGNLSSALPSNDINSYILNEVAFLDDLKEQTTKQLELNQLTEVSFAAASVIHLGTFFTNTVELRFEFFKKGSDVFANLNQLPRIGQAGNFIFGNLSKEESSKVIIRNEDIAVLPREEVPQLLKVITLTRQQLLNQLKTVQGKYIDHSETIFKLRPSYQKIWQACSSDPTDYQNQMILSMYRSSLNDYFSLLKLSPEELEKQIKSQSISYSLSSFINQEATSPALFRCLESRDKELAFIQKLFAVDLAAKVVFISTLGTIGVAAKYVISFTSGLHISRLLTAPAIRKMLTISSVVTSSQALWQLRKKYLSLHSNKDNSQQFSSKINQQIQSDIIKNIQDLERLSQQSNLSNTEIQEIKNRILEWRQLQSSYN